jgi:hypothetical protein
MGPAPALYNIMHKLLTDNGKNDGSRGKGKEILSAISLGILINYSFVKLIYITFHVLRHHFDAAFSY